jgi:hypothetical protein
MHTEFVLEDSRRLIGLMADAPPRSRVSLYWAFMDLKSGRCSCSNCCSQRTPDSWLLAGQIPPDADRPPGFLNATAAGLRAWRGSGVADGSGGGDGGARAKLGGLAAAAAALGGCASSAELDELQAASFARQPH